MGTFQIALFLTLISSASAACFFPNGVQATLDVACDPGNADSHCCANHQACLSNKLCVINPHVPNPKDYIYWRTTCTDRNWKSDACPKFCPSNDNYFVPMFSCNGTSENEYCCGQNCTCGSTNNVVTVGANPTTYTIIGEAFTKQTSSATSSVSSSSSSVISSSSSSSSSNNSGGNNSVALGVGIGVGIGGLLLIISVLIYLVSRHKNNKSQGAIGEGNPYQSGEMYQRESYPSPAGSNIPQGWNGHQWHAAAKHAPSVPPGELEGPLQLPEMPVNEPPPASEVSTTHHSHQAPNSRFA